MGATPYLRVIKTGKTGLVNRRFLIDQEARNTHGLATVVKYKGLIGYRLSGIYRGCATDPLCRSLGELANANRK